MNNPVPQDGLTSDQLQQLVVSTLEDLKAVDIQNIDVTGLSALTDRFVIASGNSSRHVKAMADKIIVQAKSSGNPPLGVEGQRQGEWVLVDLGDVVVHSLPIDRVELVSRLGSVGAAVDHPGSAEVPIGVFVDPLPRRLITYRRSM